MNYRDVADKINKEMILQTEFYKKVNVLVKNKERKKLINYLMEETGCDFEAAKILCDYYIDGVLLPSMLRLKKIIDEMEEEEQKELLNKPKCPTCQSTNIKKVSTTSKVINTAIYGIFGTKRYKTFHCNNCGYEW